MRSLWHCLYVFINPKWKKVQVLYVHIAGAAVTNMD